MKKFYVQVLVEAHIELDDEVYARAVENNNLEYLAGCLVNDLSKLPYIDGFADLPAEGASVRLLSTGVEEVSPV